MRYTKSLFGFCLLLCSNTVYSAGKIAIVVDDLGYHERDLKITSLPAKVTASILPHTPFAEQVAAQAKATSKEVMLHIPMEALSGKKLGPGALTSEMKKAEIHSSLTSALDQIPSATGVNNHMGSLLTQMSSPMEWTMEFLRENQLFFLDSKTTKFSQAKKFADKMGVESLHRHVFLDNVQTHASMNLQLQQLIRIAQKYRHAIGIAHPYPETISFLEKNLPELEKKYDVELVLISELLPSYAMKSAINSDTIAAE